nr:immunoglobulin heavy chain junction region [Macaca mulatta]MOW77280.1 immunoglobulin heavy chain junction region [Macaca mulatta]MOW77652.1 immunoglobulin heavy chain junction region [Macaca mulatta]MOW78164.1 immunoglobulin heavy chain junction region [Macaca mulatta]MOW80805.1 immunoglobulin heavy chain junction region [Macaca mulatta]
CAKVETAAVYYGLDSW